ncbi:hypothetical protein F5Y09DRAFT_355408 [Xylaria sp. FL1042]|nr:hypothetical protein F5Y09DRAFT_355408 [Xylaria sp. FL1042]
MTPEAERHLETLKAVADSYPTEWRAKEVRKCTHDTPHDAETIFRLVLTRSHAVLEPDSPKVKKFISRCIEFNTCDMETIGQPKVERMLLECFWRLDELFFFGLLVRKVCYEDTDLPKHLVTLTILKTPAPKCNNLYLWGKWTQSGTITLWPSCIEGSRQFYHVLVTLIHEMIHAWFDIFSDRNHPKHDEWVAKDGKHGVLFKEMLKFCIEYIIGRTHPNTSFSRDLLFKLESQEYWTMDKQKAWKRFF